MARFDVLTVIPTTFVRAVPRPALGVTASVLTLTARAGSSTAAPVPSEQRQVMWADH